MVEIVLYFPYLRLAFIGKTLREILPNDFVTVSYHVGDDDEKEVGEQEKDAEGQ